MPVFVEDPAQFSKRRLKSELIAHNVKLPAVDSKKQVYVELYLKHIGQKSAADFSSDEEVDQEQDVVEVQDSQDCEEEEKKKDPEMLDPCGLTDDELKTTLLKYGMEAGPIVATTRSIYERKLQRLLKPAQPRQNGGTGDADQYSDSEGEEESGSQQGRPETVSLVEENLHVDIGEPVTDVLMEMFPETEPTPTGIAATRRRPIKGAAGRPVQFKYPDLPASPMTLQRRAVERRLVPLWVQILVFFIVACLLYLIYAAMEDSLDNPFVALQDNLSMGTETEGLSLQAEP
ncbi:lamina-associated polypeptide 2, isoforms beta/delta/epsilon/gamma isoform X6 [Coregonus clupeaformis]|uniref:lamina-associated polypeptide 2, isoforms beta/delta/epsilon/gamma isoform X6 n=1 Tax=Coregonus clupeaformis TaxID=59861 RepID=UPI001BE04D76|nr:lamina-associated polypeptide 2, isoforms beta/delta/epsilon/gamma isoform X6 [Coregonus clupeaformis]